MVILVVVVGVGVGDVFVCKVGRGMVRMKV